jgi:hypothetical protein
MVATVVTVPKDGKPGDEIQVQIGSGLGRAAPVRLIVDIPKGLEPGDTFTVAGAPSRVGIVIGDRVTDEEALCLDLRHTVKCLSVFAFVLTVLNVFSGFYGWVLLFFVFCTPIGFVGASIYSPALIQAYGALSIFYVFALVLALILSTLDYFASDSPETKYYMFYEGGEVEFWVFVVWYLFLILVNTWMAHMVTTFSKTLVNVGEARMKDLQDAKSHPQQFICCLRPV